MGLQGFLEKKYIEKPLIWPNRIEARQYQKVIAEKAIHKNTLVVLPTALGKTIISTIVAAHFLYNYKNTRILVMAPTRPLVMQHKDSFMNFLTLRDKDAIALTGKIPSIYRKKIWEGDAKVIFATPQVVKNDLENNILTLKDFNLLVFDECHRARKDYAYTLVAKKYVEQSSWPTILGMTASPGAEKKRIEEICKALYIEQVEHRSEEDEDVSPYINPVKVDWKYIDLPDEFKKASKIIREMLSEKNKWLVKMGFIYKRPDYISRRELLEIGEKLRHQLKIVPNEKKGPIYSAIVVQSAALTLSHSLELLETQGIVTAKLFLDRIESESEKKKSYKSIIKDDRYGKLVELLNEKETLDHPKIEILIQEVENQLKKKDSKIIVFTQYRDTASYLVDRLKSITNASVERFVGQANKAGDRGLRQKEQAKLIEDFREGDTNVLVATCIAEEGLDIPSVDLVIFYDPIPSEIRYIQRKGRTGRKVAGKALILATKDTYDMVYLYASKRKVGKMKNIVGSLNQELDSMFRLGPKLEKVPISDEELKDIKQEAEITQTEPHLYKSEQDKVKDFIRDTDKTARRIYMKALKHGSKGLRIQDLIEEEGLSADIVKAAVEKLEEMDKITKESSDYFIVKSIKKPSNKSEYIKDVYDVRVEKVYPGRAVVWINDKWRARVASHDFEGPAKLMKKNSRFKARGKLYHEQGTLCFRIKDVIELY
jgi:Fanconi anemia group M protein